jgi:hypothetical protein
VSHSSKVIEDPILGPVTYEGTGDWHFTAHFGPGRSIKGTIVGDPSSIHDSIGTCREVIPWLSTNEKSILLSVARKMFPGWLSGWRDDEIDAISSEREFCQKLSLSGIIFLEDASFHVLIDDGGLFGGHSIVTPFDKTLRPSGEPYLFG